MKTDKVSRFGLVILAVIVLAIISSAIVLAANPVEGALNKANSIFSGGLKPYSKIIDFFVFFVIFTTVTLIGLKAMYKDKGSTNQIVALSIAIGLMSTLALMYGGTFLGKEITTATLFPYALGFLIFVVILLPLYFIINKLTGDKHKILSFFIALIITAILMFFIMGGLGKLKIPFLSGGAGGGTGGTGSSGGGSGATFSKSIKGYFYIGQSQEFADNFGNKIDKDSEIKRINDFAANCKKANVKATATKEWKTESDANKRDENNFNLAKGRCEYVSSILKDAGTSIYNACEKGDYVKVINTEYPSDRYYSATCTEEGKPEGNNDGKGNSDGGDSKNDSKTDEEVKSVTCQQLMHFNLNKFFSDIWDTAKNTWKPDGETKLNKLEEAYGKCEEERDSNPPDSEKDFQKASWNFNSELAKAWFQVREWVGARDTLVQLSTDTKGQGKIVKGSFYRQEILELWYDELIAEDMEVELKKIEQTKDPKKRAEQLIIFQKKLKEYTNAKNNDELLYYSRPVIKYT